MSSHTGFYHFGVTLVDLVSSIADPFLGLALITIIGLYRSNFSCVSLVGPFSMLVLVLAFSAACQSFTGAIVALMGHVMPSLEVVPFSGLILAQTGFTFDSFTVVVVVSIAAVGFLAGRTLFLSSKSSIRRIF